MMYENAELHKFLNDLHGLCIVAARSGRSALTFPSHVQVMNIERRRKQCVQQTWGKTKSLRDCARVSEAYLRTFWQVLAAMNVTSFC